MKLLDRILDLLFPPKCPFCGTSFRGLLPVLNLYHATHKPGEFRPDNHRLMVYTGQSLYLWHANRGVAPNERITPEQAQRVGYFVFHNSQWWLVNERLPDMLDVSGNTAVPIGQRIELKDGQQILLAKGEGGRLLHVQMVDAR